jgi:hypothetical protein
MQVRMAHSTRRHPEMSLWGHSRQSQPTLPVCALLLRPESGLEAGPATSGLCVRRVGGAPLDAPHLAHVAERHRRAGCELALHQSSHRLTVRTITMSAASITNPTNTANDVTVMIAHRSHFSERHRPWWLPRHWDRVSPLRLPFAIGPKAECSSACIPDQT